MGDCSCSGILLTESDFLSFDGLLSPDFTGGGLITFGFVTWNSSGNSISVTNDNYSATLTVIPGPAAIELLIPGGHAGIALPPEVIGDPRAG